jgi:hypothetical protein
MEDEKVKILFESVTLENIKEARKILDILTDILIREQLDANEKTNTAQE